MEISFANTMIEQDLRMIWHPYTQMQTAPPPIPIVSAKGSYLYAADGKRYLDAISSWWVNLHGHAHPYIVSKLQKQLEILPHVLFAGCTHPPAIDLAARLLQILPGGMSKLFYSDNGSTAVEVALKMAIQYWHNKNDPKSKVMCFKNSYHGDTFGAMSAAGKNAFNRPFWKQLFHAVAIDVPMPGFEMESINQLEMHLQQGDVACFIFEPLILGTGGMKIYSKEGLEALLKLCKHNEVLTIADEVMTGFGRTGSLFACNPLQTPPDLICLSKGLTGGFLPLGVTACTQEIFNAFLSNDLQNALLHGHSYTANPLACCSALASLDLLLSCDKRMNIEKMHHAFCNELKGHPKLSRCEAIGTILVLEYIAEGSSYFQKLGQHLYAYFLSKGVLLRPLGNVVYVMPPYCIEDEELRSIYEIIKTQLCEL